jgi:uracil-DNA glycosylase family 4
LAGRPRRPKLPPPPTAKHPACAGCKYDPLWEGFVGATGPVSAKVAIVGEAPGTTEVRLNEPFVGPAGRQLNDLLLDAGLSREEVYITNVVKCAPPRGGKLKTPTLDQIRTCRQRHLDDELKGLSPHVVGLLGNVPLAAFGKSSRSNAAEASGILKWEGSVFPVDWPDGRRIKAIALLHPAALMTYQRLRKRLPVSRKFYRRLGEQSHSPDLPPEDWEIVTDCDSTFPAWLESFLSRPRPISVDIETSGGSLHDCRILCIGFSDGKVGYSIPWDDPCCGRDEVVRHLLANPDVPKVLQNGVFDISVLQCHGVPVRGPILDTCFLHHVHFAELPHSLAFLASIYTWMPYFKDETKDGDGKSQDFGKVDPEVLRAYNAKDAIAQYRVAVGLKRDATLAQRTFYTRIVQRLIPAVADMQATGIAVDTLARNHLAASLREEMSQAVESLRPLGLEAISRDRLRYLLFTTWNLTPLELTEKKGVGKVNDALFRHLLRTSQLTEEQRKVIAALSRYFEIEKLVSTFVEGLTVDSDGRARASWSIHGTRTGRLSCKNPNLQNQPDEVRHLFVPSPGRIFVQLDYSSFEAWGIALLSGDANLLAILRSGRDFHLAMLAKSFSLDYDDLLARYQQGDPEVKKLRDMRKTATYAGNYGAGPDKLHAVMALSMEDPPSIEEVRLLYARDAAAFPAVTRFRADIGNRLRDKRKLVGPFGRERIFLGIPDEVVTEAYDFPVQNLAADLVNQVHAQLYDKLGPGIIVAQGHDSFLFDLPITELPFIKTIREIAGQPFSFPDWWGRNVTHAFHFEVKVGPSWAHNSLKPLTQ